MSSLRRDRPHDGVEVLRLDRPDRLNAFDTALLDEVNGALEAVAADPGVRALVVSTTSPAALSAGADVDEALDAAGGVRRMEAFARMYAAIEAVPVPTIAVCVGHCVGAGAELAAGCDLRVAGENLRARWVGALHGVPVGPARLVPLVGLALAKDLALTSRVLEADEALRIGFVRSVHPPEEAEAAGLLLAAELAGRGDGPRTLKALFAQLGDGAARVERENAALVAFQRGGGGLPRR
ncbi:MAG TPA: enoyl-CoA hydratase/isomerase family protein [Solirubrobacteraceae bacterium]|nr:enoyl-CoA hydratase/isomerase family protein [Solirubrobacteraceae bacterium]